MPRICCCPLYQEDTINQYSAQSLRAQPIPGIMATNPNTPAPPATRTNPISLRIYKAIGTSFDDVSSREALEIASGMYGPEEPKGKGKAQSGYEEIEEDDDTLPRRRTLKGQSAAIGRKYLKQDIETSLATGSAKFLEAFAEVDKVGLLSNKMYLTG